jgi:hypothetical protein
MSRNMIYRFLEKLEQNSTFPTILTQLQQLDNKTTWDQNDHLLFGQIDTQFTTVLLNAEQESALPTQCPWSPELHYAQLKYTYWVIKWKGCINRIDVTKQLTKITNQLPNNDAFQPNINRQPLAQLRHSRKHLINCRIQSFEHQDRFHTIQHEKIIEEGKMQKADAVRHKRNREQQRKCWQLLRTIIHGQRTSGGISHVLITLPSNPNPHNIAPPPQCIQTKHDMDRVLLDRNIDHFSQAHGTPFTISPLLEIFGTDVNKSRQRV